MNTIKILLLLPYVSILFLVIAVFFFPSSGYFVFLRWIVSVGLLVNMFKNRKLFPQSDANTIVFILLVILLFIFNPIFPIYLHDRSTWVILDILAIALLLLSNFDYAEVKKKIDNIWYRAK